ncbi:MAG: sigma-70 family RNA polymerase sigma factor [Clostridiales bacterium]|jgi:RNA polymerase sigma-70 factor (ECF subfamily)|nr:sigma-70 family RNA polymerase sigma factor [Clostridiales bacterium]
MNAHGKAAPLMGSVREKVVPARQEMDDRLLEAIYNRHYDAVYNYICFRINNHFDAEELAADTFENAIRRYHTYRPQLGPIQAWLIGIAKNVVADYFRGKKRRTFVPLDDIAELVSPSRRPDEVVVFNEDNRALMRAMSTLKDAERQILSMKFATDLKNHEIAKIMGLSDTNVGTIVNRSVKKLKKILEKEERS